VENKTLGSLARDYQELIEFKSQKYEAEIKQLKIELAQTEESRRKTQERHEDAERTIASSYQTLIATIEFDLELYKKKDYTPEEAIRYIEESIKKWEEYHGYEGRE